MITTILLTGLMCFSSINGFFTVICHGSDGHIAVEPVIHNHCECPETSESGHQDMFAGIAVKSCRDHGHCADTIVTSDYIVPARKNIKSQLAEVFVQSPHQKSISNQMTSSFGHSFSWDTELSSFFRPLQSIIILA